MSIISRVHFSPLYTKSKREMYLKVVVAHCLFYSNPSKNRSGSQANEWYDHEKREMKNNQAWDKGHK